MFCPKCGSTLPDGSTFCGGCGTNFAPEAQNNNPGAGAQPAQSTPAQEPILKKLFSDKKTTTLGLGVLGAFVVILIAILAISGVFSPKNAYVYLADGNYMLLNDLNSKDNIEISGLKEKNGNDETGTVKFSDDGKYVYFITRYDGSYGTLNRVEYAKLKANSSDNDKVIEQIDTNVSTEFTVLKNNKVLYKKEGNKLYFHNGKEAVKIDERVSNFVCGDGEKLDVNKLVYLAANDEGEYSLYAVDLGKPDDAKKLASKVDEYSLYLLSFDTIFYTKTTGGDEEDGERETNLYSIKFDGKDEIKIGKNPGRFYYYEDEKMYFTVENGEKVLLDAFVEDDDDEDYDDLREELKDKDNAIRLRTLYRFENNKLEKLNEKVLGEYSENGAILFATSDQEIEKIDIAEAGYAGNVEYHVMNNAQYNCALLKKNSKIYKLSAKALEDIKEAKEEKEEDDSEEYSSSNIVRLVFTEKEAYMFANEGMFVASYKGDSVEGFSSKVADIAFAGAFKDKVYYWANEDDGIADLYRYDGENNKVCVAKKVEASRAVIYDDNVIIARNDDEEHLWINSNGEVKLKIEDLEDLIRVDGSTALYLSGDELYSFNGNEKKKIRSDVDRIWSLNSMEMSVLYNSY